MSVDRTSLKVRAFERRWKRKGEDLCDLIKPTFQDGGSAGDSVTTGTEAADVHVIYEPSGQNSQVIVGGKAYVGSHKLELERTTAAAAITPEYRIRVHARGAKSEMIFEEPVILQQEFDPVLTVMVSLVQQGFQQ